ncbi:methyltransferase type 11 [Bacillus cereus]|nr:methyltransferase type 11 [Bacillus cereus]
MEFSNGINAPKENYGKGRKMISVMDILADEPIVYRNIRNSVQVDDKTESKNKVENGDLVFVRSSEIPDEVGWAKAYRQEEYALYSGFSIRGKKKSDFDAKFIELSLNNSNREQIERKAGGSTRFNVSQSILKSIEILEPSIEEQIEIGNFFERLDETIALHQQELTILKQTKQGFLQKMFPKEGESVPEIRFPGFSGNWEERKLKDIVTLLKDGTHGTHKEGKDAFLLSAKNIKNGQIIINELTDRKISSDDYNSIFKNYKLMDQDLLITIVGTIGQTALYTETTSKLAFQRSVAIIRGTKDMNQNFLKSTVNSNYVQKQLKQSASMSAQAGVYLGDLEKLKINTPELSEQVKIGNFFKKLDDTITLHQSELDALKEMKKAFLQKMFA